MGLKHPEIVGGSFGHLVENPYEIPEKSLVSVRENHPSFDSWMMTGPHDETESSMFQPPTIIIFISQGVPATRHRKRSRIFRWQILLVQPLF